MAEPHLTNPQPSGSTPKEQTLRENGTRLRAILSAMPDLVFVLNREGRYIEVLTADESLLYAKPDDLKGRLLHEVLPKNDADCFLELIQRTIETETTQVLEYPLDVQAGRRWFEARTAPQHRTNGGPSTVVLIARDITLRKEAERRLLMHHAVTRVLAEATSLREATPRILQAVCHSLRWTFGGLWWIDAKADVLRCVEIWQESPDRLQTFVARTREITFARKVGLPGRVWTSNQPAWIPDVTLDSNFPRASVAAQGGLHAAFAFPIRIKGDVAGVMDFFSSQIHQPNDDLLRLVDSVGSQIGQFVERKRAEEALLDAYSELEGRVNQRTEQLSSTNAMLLQEVEERKQAELAIVSSEEKYRNLFEHANDSIFIIDPSTHRFLDVNAHATQLVGYTREELLRLTIHDIDTPAAKAQSAAAVKTMQKVGHVIFDHELMHKNRTVVPVEISSRVIEYGARRVFQSFVRDITDRKQTEAKTKSSLKEKELLLREIQHRVKNNLQIINSLLDLQALSIRNKKAKVVFEECQNRIKSMALLYEKLYMSADLGNVQLRDYTQSIIDHLTQFYGPIARRVSVQLECAQVAMGLDCAIPCGLIINELVSNALKHGFPNNRRGRVKITIRPSRKNRLELIVSDDGIGLPDGLDSRLNQTLGLQLTQALAREQLHGRIKSKSTNGTTWTVTFATTLVKEET